MWSVVAVALAAILFWVATSEAVYEATSPSSLSWHVALRKAYSILAFALVGFSADNALDESTRPILRGLVLIAMYSAAIELAQALNGSREGLGWNAFDVACGAAGGALGAWVATLIRSRRTA
jgi:hypothetical protein